MRMFGAGRTGLILPLPYVRDAPPLARVGAATADPGRDGPERYLAVTMAEADEAAIAAAVVAGAVGLLVAGWRTAADVERLSVRLAVVEARLGLAEGRLRLILVGDGAAAGSLALPPDAGRLAMLGIDTAGLPPGALPVARGLALLAAVAAGVPALAVAKAGEDLAPRAAEGFTAALVPAP